MVFDIDDATDVNVCLGDEKITTCLKNGSQACTLVNDVAADLVFFVFHRFLVTHSHKHSLTLSRSLFQSISVARIQSRAPIILNVRM